MNHQSKLNFIEAWAKKRGVDFLREGECGIGRECVGISYQDHYVDYEWSDPVSWNRIDKNGEVWTPQNAYHKHPCLAVLGHGEEAESQLYDWLVWFDQNGFELRIETNPEPQPVGIIAAFMYRRYITRMVKV